jgi:hypothetical protein
MGERGGEADKPRLIVDICRLDGCDLMTAERLAHDLEAARERRIAKGLIMIARMARMVATSDFSGLVSSTCALARAAAIEPIVSLDRCTVLLSEEMKADRARL